MTIPHTAPQQCAAPAAPRELMTVASLDAGQLEVLTSALDDAISYRDPSGFCTACEDHPASLCDDHAADLDLADSYIALGRELGVEGIAR